MQTLLLILIPVVLYFTVMIPMITEGSMMSDNMKVLVTAAIAAPLVYFFLVVLLSF